jgi:dimethylhistidine N-methyltransferase
MSADAFSSPAAAFRAAVAEGFSATPKTISPKWLYDALGSKLFDAITELPEYALTRTEIALLHACIGEAVAGLGQGAIVVELGAGSAVKTPILLEALTAPSVYAPIDVAEAALASAAQTLAERFPALDVHPLTLDFTGPWRAPQGPGRVVCFFPGSTIGNLEPAAAIALLKHARAAVGPRGVMLLGVDAPKDEETLLEAYDDRLGVTAAFNANLLVRLNRELGGDADIQSFSHEARWNADESRIEMHLVSLRDQLITCAAGRFRFAQGESLHTENSYKWGPDGVRRLAETAGWRLDRRWMAPQDAFGFYRLV